MKSSHGRAQIAILATLLIATLPLDAWSQRGGRGGGGGRSVSRGGGASSGSMSRSRPSSGGGAQRARQSSGGRAQRSQGTFSRQPNRTGSASSTPSSDGRQQAARQGQPRVSADPANREQGTRDGSLAKQENRQAAISDNQANRGSTAEDRQSSRQDQQDQNREDWQSHTSDAREDRQDYGEDMYEEYGGVNWYGGAYVGGGYHNEAAVFAAFTTGLVIGTAISSTTYTTATAQSGCTMTEVEVNGTTYYRCPPNWFTRVMQGGEVSYMVVTAPAGF